MRDSEEIEKILISRLINKPREYYDNHTQLHESLFHDIFYKEMFIWLDEAYQNGGKFNLLKCSQDLSKKDSLSSFPVDYNVAIAMDSDLSYMHEAQTLISYLSDVNKKISIKSICEDALINVDKLDIDDIISKIETRMHSLNANDKGEIIEIKERLKDAIKMIEENSMNPGMSGIPSGFESIDKFTGGWQPQDLIIVGGASSMGKTSFSLALAYNASLYQYPSVVFSYEMSVNQLISRILSVETEIDNRYLIKGTLTSDEWGLIQKAQGKIEKAPLYIDECSNTSLKYLMNKIRQYVITKGIQLVMIDYLQLISNHVKGRSREQEVSIIARSLKNIAKELDITIIALSQLSRSVERNEAARPMMSNLRESGEIEQAADAVVFVYRPEYYGYTEDQEGNSTEGKAEIIFAKGRNIGTGSKWLGWVNYLTKFIDLKDDETYC